MRVRRLAALTAALPLLALSGCGGDNPKPKPLDPPSTSASPSPTATTTPQAETPEEVIRKFVAAQNQMMADGKTTEFLTLSSRCDYCSGLADGVSTVYDNGGYIKTRGWTIVSMKPPVKLGDGDVSVRFAVDSAPTSYRESKGSKLKSYEGATGLEKRVSLRKVAGHWRIDYLAEVS